MSGVTNSLIDQSKSDECLNKTSSMIEMRESEVSALNSSNLMNNSSLQTSRFQVSGVNIAGSESKDADGEDLGLINHDASVHRNRHTSGHHNGYESDGDGPLASPVGSYGNQQTYGGDTYATKNLKSLRHYTREAIPRADNYRNMMSIHNQINRSTRPTMDELIGNQTTIMGDGRGKSIHGDPRGVAPEMSTKFGWIQGVLVRCLLNIWGVMLFLRLSWVVAHAGIGQGFLIILLATAVTTITALSMSAICTNGEVKGGGTYFMISRSLGPEVGGAIGLIFSLANAVAIAMYAVGFAETLAELLNQNGLNITDDQLDNVRIISCVAVTVLLCIALIGTEWESKAQIVLLIILLLAMADYVIGSLIPANDQEIAQGFVGWNLKTLAENFRPDYRNETFFSVFSVFFPAATGITAGANISGDLKDPQFAIPLGTLLAILITTISYLGFAFISGGVVVRDATGLVQNYTRVPLDEALSIVTDCNLTKGCSFGSHHSFGVMELVSVWGPIITAGIFAASLSSALASLVSAPKIFQALAKDKLFPYIGYFAKGFGKDNEPRRGYFLAFGVAIGCCIIGDLNLIAPIISNFFLAAYCLINFSCFHASFAKSLGFRPSFRYYNMWSSLAGSLLCLVVMFITDWVTALITFVIIMGLYIWVLYRKPDVNWGSSTQAQTFRAAIQYVYKLSLLPDHVKNYRPQILVLTGDPSSRPALVDFGYSITRGIGLIICGQATHDQLSLRRKQATAQSATDWLVSRKVKAFFNLCEEETFTRSVSSMIQSLGIGKLRPNFVLMGWKNNWRTSPVEEFIDYYNCIVEVFDKHMALAILRVPGGLDCSDYDQDSTEKGPNGGVLNTSFASIEMGDVTQDQSETNSSFQNTSRRSSSTQSDSSPPNTPMLTRNQDGNNISIDPTGDQMPHIGFAPRDVKSEIPRDVLSSCNQFQRRQKKGTIDVWWLYDDGGLTMLVPFLLSTRNQWSGCKLRVFSLANKRSELDRDQRNMAALLSKFRIDYSDVTVIPDVHKAARPDTKQKWKDLIAKFRVTPDDTKDTEKTANGTSTNATESSEPMVTEKCEPSIEPEPNPAVITKAELVACKDKVRLHECPSVTKIFDTSGQSPPADP